MVNELDERLLGHAATFAMMRLEEAIDALKIAFRNLKEAIEPIWDELQKFINSISGMEYEKKRLNQEHIRSSWVVPRKIPFHNQVLFREPIISRARSNL